VKSVVQRPSSEGRSTPLWSLVRTLANSNRHAVDLDLDHSRTRLTLASRHFALRRTDGEDDAMSTGR